MFLKALTNNETIFQKIVSSFSMINNAKKVFNTSSEDFHLKSLHAIRFISLSWVILGHTYGFLALYSDNLLQIESLFKRFSFSIIINGYFSVDSFFLLSGLLSSYMFLKEASKPQFRLNFCFFMKYYIHRLWRLIIRFLYYSF
jgi:peptidoglycan/LPS O-acetylase OafA/YrhL